MANFCSKSSSKWTDAPAKKEYKIWKKYEIQPLKGALKKIQKQAENERSKHVEEWKSIGVSFPVYGCRHECRPGWGHVGQLVDIYLLLLQGSKAVRTTKAAEKGGSRGNTRKNHKFCIHTLPKSLTDLWKPQALRFQGVELRTK